MGELIRTRYEYVMCKALEDLKIPFQIFQLFDFQCGQYFRWSKWEPPKLCLKCNTPLIPKQFARPDILITSTDKKRVGVIRIDGGVHEKKRVKSNDYFQTLKFFDCGVKVFIVKNEDIDKRYSATFQPHALALLFKRLLDEPELYDKIYTKSKYWEEHNRKL